jgi:hypothetical protein
LLCYQYIISSLKVKQFNGRRPFLGGLFRLYFLKKAKKNRKYVFPVFYHHSSVSAPMGQNRTHFPQRIHASISTSGAENPSWDNASTGHTRTEGHG